MPADFINIGHPDSYSPESDRFRHNLETEMLRTELKQTRVYHRGACERLEAIFNRIERGDPVELHYPDGRVFIVSGSVKT